MSIEGYGDLADWEAFAAREGERLKAEVETASALKHTIQSSGLTGYCPVCTSRGKFVVPVGGIGPETSFREFLNCESCGCISRHRAAISVLRQALPEMNHARIYITEQATPLFIALRKRMRGLVGSEFAPKLRTRLRLSLWMWSKGGMSFGRYQDVTDLSFRSGSMDAVVSLDVLEHVPDYPQALREFARVIKPGGVLVMTVPFTAASAPSETIAHIRDDGSIEHIGAPEYHGDPLGHGVLCFHHLGWDLLASMRDAGFAEAEAVRVSDVAQGVPEPLWLFRARR